MVPGRCFIDVGRQSETTFSYLNMGKALVCAASLVVSVPWRLGCSIRRFDCSVCDPINTRNQNLAIRLLVPIQYRCAKRRTLPIGGGEGLQTFENLSDCHVPGTCRSRTSSASAPSLRSPTPSFGQPSAWPGGGRSSASTREPPYYSQTTVGTSQCCCKNRPSSIDAMNHHRALLEQPCTSRPPLL